MTEKLRVIMRRKVPDTDIEFVGVCPETGPLGKFYSRLVLNMNDAIALIGTAENIEVVNEDASTPPSEGKETV